MLLLRRIIFLLLLFILSQHVYSQTATISGTVLDSLRKPLYGVSVAVFGQPFATTTTDQGKYSLTIPASQNLKIIFSFTGLHADSMNVNLSSGEKKGAAGRIQGAQDPDECDTSSELRQLRSPSEGPMRPQSRR